MEDLLDDEEIRRKINELEEKAQSLIPDAINKTLTNVLGPQAFQNIFGEGFDTKKIKKQNKLKKIELNQSMQSNTSTNLSKNKPDLLPKIGSYKLIEGLVRGYTKVKTKQEKE